MEKVENERLSCTMQVYIIATDDAIYLELKKTCLFRAYFTLDGYDFICLDWLYFFSSPTGF